MNHYSLTYTSNPFLKGNAYGYWKNKAKTSLNYCTFGAPMPGLTYEAPNAKYRFGQNGQEKDDEIYGAGNTYSAEYWEYDARLGRRWNTDPRPNPSISPYACFENNPIFNRDIKGDSINTDQEGFDIINEGLIATLGKESPFGYDKDKGQITFNKDFDRTKFTDKQLKLIDRYSTLVISKKDIVNVFVVDFIEKLEELDNQSLKDQKSNGITIPYSVTENGVEVGTIQNVYIARDPRGISTDNGLKEARFEDARPYYRGLASIHEIAGHAYLRVAEPTLPVSEQNRKVEKYEDEIRTFYIYNGTPIKGYSRSHEE